MTQNCNLNIQNIEQEVSKPCSRVKAIQQQVQTVFYDEGLLGILAHLINDLLTCFSQVKLHNHQVFHYSKSCSCCVKINSNTRDTLITFINTNILSENSDIGSVSVSFSLYMPMMAAWKQ